MTFSLKFKWRPQRNTEQSWALGLVTRGVRAAGYQSRVLVISVQRLLLGMLLSAVLAYFAGTAVLFLWLDRRPYNFVRYGDLINPWRWSEIPVLRGKAFIAEGIDDMNANRWSGGVMKLNAGLRRYPQDSNARFKLASFFLAVNSRVRALNLLSDGMDYGYPGRSYMKLILQLAASAEDYDLCIEFCDLGLAKLDAQRAKANPEERTWLLQQKLIVLTEAKRADEALTLVKVVQNLNPALANEATVQALLQQKRTDEALIFLNDWQARDGQTEQVLRFQARAYREAGRLDDMDRALRAYRKRAPIDPEAACFSVVQRLLAGRPADAEREFEDFFLRFGGDQKNLLLMAKAVGEAGDLKILSRCETAAIELGGNPAPYQRERIEVLISLGRWKESRLVFGQISALQPETPLEFREWYHLTALRLDALLDPADGVQASLTAYVRQRQFSLKLYRELITESLTAGHLQTARDLAVFALGVYPDSEFLRQHQTELTEKIAAIRAAQAAGDLDSTRAAITSEEAFLAQIDPLVAAGKFTEAKSLIRELRKGQPTWLDRQDSRFRLIELQAALGQDDLSAVQGAARTYLNGNRDRADITLKLAKELKAAGRGGPALLLVHEVLRKSPDLAPALELKKEWEPKKPAPETLPTIEKPIPEKKPSEEAPAATIPPT